MRFWIAIVGPRTRVVVKSWTTQHVLKQVLMEVISRPLSGVSTSIVTGIVEGMVEGAFTVGCDE